MSELRPFPSSVGEPTIARKRPQGVPGICLRTYASNARRSDRSCPAYVSERTRLISEALLRSQSNDDFPVRIEGDAEAALVMAGLGFPQAGNAAAGRIAVGIDLGEDIGGKRWRR